VVSPWTPIAKDLCLDPREQNYPKLDFTTLQDRSSAHTARPLVHSSGRSEPLPRLSIRKTIVSPNESGLQFVEEASGDLGPDLVCLEVVDALVRHLSVCTALLVSLVEFLTQSSLARSETVSLVGRSVLL
jgi:hypothetical protein